MIPVLVLVAINVTQRKMNIIPIRGRKATLYLNNKASNGRARLIDVADPVALRVDEPW